MEGGGFLYGDVEANGLFGGPKNAYIYPDMITALVGKFSQGKILPFSPCHLDYPQEYIFAYEAVSFKRIPKEIALLKVPTKSFGESK